MRITCAMGGLTTQHIDLSPTMHARQSAKQDGHLILLLLLAGLDALEPVVVLAAGRRRLLLVRLVVVTVLVCTREKPLSSWSMY